MSEIIACLTNAGVPLVAPTDLPTVRIRRSDTGVLVITDSAMVELGDGCFVFTFAPVVTLEYSIRVDGDPLVTGQVPATSRYLFGALSGIEENEIETNIPALLTGQTTIIGNQTTLLTGQGTITTNQATIIAGVAANLVAIGLLNNLSQAGVQAALDAQGYTTVRAALLDNLGTMATRLILVEKLLRNRFETDDVTGIATLYDDDSLTPLLSTPIFQDVLGTIPYAGAGIERRNRLV